MTNRVPTSGVVKTVVIRGVSLDPAHHLRGVDAQQADVAAPVDRVARVQHERHGVAVYDVPDGRPVTKKVGLELFPPHRTKRSTTAHPRIGARRAPPTSCGLPTTVSCALPGAPQRR